MSRGRNHTANVRAASTAATGRVKNAAKPPSDLMTTRRSSLEHAAQHDAEDRRRDREAVVLEHVGRDAATSITVDVERVLLIANEPTTQNSMMTGIRTLRGTLRICLRP
jgi:hypothetical protein